MSTWTTDQLDRIAAAEELRIAPRREDGTLRNPTTIWVVREGDALYVRSWRGTGGVWWTTAHDTRSGRVSAGGVTVDVAFAPEPSQAVNDRVDAAYQGKYGRYTDYVAPMVAEPARATTLRVTPA
ncbi:MAG: DUF2255 family protein [Actinomycetia bacterium]|nr:DUF2255 family protein [Actinomycetes bacterium]